MDKAIDKPIPAFYCCYLLRSKNRKSYYIGSTPSPARRLAQHNGSSTGGAKRTSMQGKRPWEMTCIVTGFPSKFAALQFEWAWQNTHMTRHIEREVRDKRIEELQKKGKTIEGAGRRKKRPPMSLEARLKNLHYLLRVKSFERWPLHVRFFASDVFTLWEKHTAKMSLPLRKSIVVRLTPAELPPASTVDNQTPQIPTIIQEIAVAYEDCKSHIEKSKRLFENGRAHACSVCRNKLDASTSLYLLCPHEACAAVSHMSCLSSKFLAEEGNRAALIPIEGMCPGCHTPLKWATLTKELSLRLRGEKEIEAMFKPKRRTKANNVSEGDSTELQELGEDEDLDETWIQEVDDVDDEPLALDDRFNGKAQVTR